MILAAGDLARLDRLSLRVGRPRIGTTAGLRRSPRAGASIEFADYRSYASGDDFRRVDWKAYARFERLVVRLHEGEEDTCVSVWVDASASMAGAKLTAATGLAAALTYIALGSYDRASCVAFAADVVARTPPVRGRRSAPRLWQQLDNLTGEGGTDWQAIANAARTVPPGPAVVVSDFLTESGPDLGLGALRETGHDLALVQVLAPEELQPDLQGDVRLVDAETAAVVDISAGAAAIQAYHEALTTHTDGLLATAAAYGAPFVQVNAADPAVELVLGPLRHAGIVQ
jgi:uncharacterized protein (DUF58 family)